MELLTAPPEGVILEVLGALRATGLQDSFGAVDLIQSTEGRWLVLEVNTDGVFNFVARDVPVPELKRLLADHVARSFRRRLERMGNPG